VCYLTKPIVMRLSHFSHCTHMTFKFVLSRYSLPFIMFAFLLCVLLIFASIGLCPVDHTIKQGPMSVQVLCIVYCVTSYSSHSWISFFAVMATWMSTPWIFVLSSKRFHFLSMYVNYDTMTIIYLFNFYFSTVMRVRV
jgi:hypothetical protein